MKEDNFVQLSLADDDGVKPGIESSEGTAMRQIDEARLETDLGYRFGYLAEFMGFGAGGRRGDPRGGPGTWRRWCRRWSTRSTTSSTATTPPGGTSCPRQHGYEGDVPSELDDLTMDHAQIQFRKEHLGRYLAALVTRPYDEKMVVLPRHGRQDAHAQGRLGGPGRPARADERPAGLRRRRPDGHDPRPGPGLARQEVADPPGVRQAALAPERPDQPPLCGAADRPAWVGWPSSYRNRARR